MPIPASEESKLPVFQGLYADIAEGRAGPAGRSAFSLHLTRIKEVLAEADERSLILLDELGNGTEPGEAAALAQAALEALVEKKAKVAAVTHLPALKQFAFNFAVCGSFLGVFVALSLSLVVCHAVGNAVTADVLELVVSIVFSVPLVTTWRSIASLLSQSVTALHKANEVSAHVATCGSCWKECAAVEGTCFSQQLGYTCEDFIGAGCDCAGCCARGGSECSCSSVASACMRKKPETGIALYLVTVRGRSVATKSACR